jgi:hypothetical protein
MGRARGADDMYIVWTNEESAATAFNCISLSLSSSGGISGRIVGFQKRQKPLICSQNMQSELTGVECADQYIHS